MEAVVDTFGRLLLQLQPDAAKAYRPGLDVAGLRSTCDRLGVGSLPADLETLYLWRDPPEQTTNLGGDDTWWLLGSAEAVRVHEELCERFEAEHLYHPCWIPFLRNGSGDYLCVASGSDATGIPSDAVLEVSLDSLDRPVRYASVARWLELTVRGLESGLLCVEEDGGLRPPDPIAWEGFLDEANPGFVNGDPICQAETATGGALLLRRLATGLGSLSLIALAVTAKVFRRQLPRSGFVAILVGLVLAGLFLLAAHIVASRREG